MNGWKDELKRMFIFGSDEVYDENVLKNHKDIINIFEKSIEQFIESLLKEQRENDISAFGRALEIWLKEDTTIYGKTIGKAIGGKRIDEKIREQLNAPEPTGEVK